MSTCEVLSHKETGIYTIPLPTKLGTIMEAEVKRLCEPEVREDQCETSSSGDYRITVLMNSDRYGCLQKTCTKSNQTTFQHVCVCGGAQVPPLARELWLVDGF